MRPRRGQRVTGPTALILGLPQTAKNREGPMVVSVTLDIFLLTDTLTENICAATCTFCPPARPARRSHANA